MTFAIVGAGPTGVELAGQIRELACRSLTRDFRSIDPTSVRVILIDGGKEPLANFGNQLSVRARHSLEKMGVELQMGLRVVGCRPFGVDTENEDKGKRRFECGTTIWAAGVQASPLAGMLAEATGAHDRPGRADRGAPRPQPARSPRGLRRRRHGDPQRPARRLRGGHAGRPARGEHDQATVEGQASADRSSTATSGARPAIGRFKSIVSFRGIRLSGFPGWVVWFFVHIGFLNGFGNRASTMLRWFRSMVGRARPERVFSVGHTGGDLSLPDDVKARVMPNAFPVQADAAGWAERVEKSEAVDAWRAAGGGTTPAAPQRPTSS